MPSSLEPHAGWWSTVPRWTCCPFASRVHLLARPLSEHARCCRTPPSGEVSSLSFETAGELRVESRRSRGPRRSGRSSMDGYCRPPEPPPTRNHICGWILQPPRPVRSRTYAHGWNLQPAGPRTRPNSRPWMEITASRTRTRPNPRPWMEIAASRTRTHPNPRPWMEIAASGTRRPTRPGPARPASHPRAQPAMPPNARARLKTSGRAAARASTSARVEVWPKEKRSAEPACRTVRPNASST
jgi:hypothetical protein